MIKLISKILKYKSLYHCPEIFCNLEKALSILLRLYMTFIFLLNERRADDHLSLLSLFPIMGQSIYQLQQDLRLQGHFYSGKWFLIHLKPHGEIWDLVSNSCLADCSLTLISLYRIWKQQDALLTSHHCEDKGSGGSVKFAFHSVWETANLSLQYFIYIIYKYIQ